MRGYLLTLGTALSVLVNALLAGQPTETLCYRAAKARRAGRGWGCVFCQLADLFDRDHCGNTLRWWETRRERDMQSNDRADAAGIDRDERGLAP
ncbi:hypothetical protein [Ancylobacter rudongensis]|uniref:Secreted protein n=1 Tax=Ancylobacter rudongensis TaxID=177413 RepID=A0A1G4UPM6_9HYPH|nr:hypothetical protein [Ancylobacter rudongensis]SCW95611.1 hypothetical protein SAMN05660859_0065 [Ancylobacter rudongensis]